MGTGRAAMALASTGFTICGAKRGEAATRGASAHAAAASLKKRRRQTEKCNTPHRRAAKQARSGNGGALRAD
jgi:hypothetical protein